MKTVLAAALVLQAVFSIRLDEDPGSGDEAAQAARDARALDEAKEKATAAAKAVSGAVSDDVQDAAKAAGPPPVQPAPTKAPPMTAPAKPKIEFEKEDHPLKKIIEKDGLKKYDLDGSTTLDHLEFRQLVHDVNPVDPIAISDAEVDRLLKTYDSDHDTSLSKKEVIKFLEANPTEIARLPIDIKACSGWSPEEGPTAGKGGSCRKWGFQINWCFVAMDFNGPGSGRKQESETYPGKYFAPCVPPPVPAGPATPPPTPAPDIAAEKAKEALQMAAETMKEAEAPGSASGGGYEYSYGYDYVEE